MGTNFDEIELRGSKMIKLVIALGLTIFFSACASQSARESEIEQRKIFDQTKEEKSLELDQQAAREREELARQQAVIDAQSERLDQEQDSAQKADTEEMGSPEIASISDSDVGDTELDMQAEVKDTSQTNLLAQRIILFEYDRFDIPREFISLVEAHATHLLKNPEIKIVIHGHCDTRGSREYNLALGQRRAESVRKAMRLLGVADDQIQVVSFGSEKPTAHGQDEESHRQNRRSEIVYESKSLP